MDYLKQGLSEIPLVPIECLTEEGSSAPT
jgi:hypothetical protein